MRHAVVTDPAARIALPAAPLAKFLGNAPATVRIERRSLSLEVRSPGRLVPWIGPAIRGITALRYRAAVCRQPQVEWAGRWKHCHGCPHLPSCGYGIAFEPEGQGATVAGTAPSDKPAPPADAAATPGTDAVRRIVIAPSFPTPVAATRGQTISIDVTSIGSEASANVPGIIDALAEAGRRDGLGPDRVRFTIAAPRAPADVVVVDPARLPRLAAAPSLPRLTIRLSGPLFLRQREARSRRPILEPDFRAFVRHAVRIVGEFLPAAEDVSADDHEPLAATVATVASDIRPFRQEKASRRTFRRFEMEGVVGSIMFADVPACFLPWLMLAGILHVGGHRVDGAGGWTVHTDAATTAAAAGTSP